MGSWNCNFLRYVLFSVLSLVLYACSGGSSKPQPPVEPPPVITVAKVEIAPTTVLLVAQLVTDTQVVGQPEMVNPNTTVSYGALYTVTTSQLIIWIYTR